MKYEENMYAEIARTPLEHTSTRAAILRMVSYALPQRATHLSDGALVSHSWPPLSPRYAASGLLKTRSQFMDCRCAVAVFAYGETLPLHSGVQYPYNEIEDPVIAECILGSTLRHGQV